MSTPTTRTWLITGTSSGFGLELAKVVASKGDRVIATSRSLPGAEPPSKTSTTNRVDDDILAHTPGVTRAQLDHNQSLEQVRAAVAAIVAAHGVPDVVVNNAAYIQPGFLEAASPEATARQYQANLFGPLNVYRAVVPYLRAAAAARGSTNLSEKKGGAAAAVLVTNGSVTSWFPFRGTNLYTSAKSALRNATLGLAEELRPFGIRHLLIEPGFFRTALLDPHFGNIGGGGGGEGGEEQQEEEEGQAQKDSGPGWSHLDSLVPEYEEQKQAVDATLASYDGSQPGDPVRACELLFEVITSTGRAEGRELPTWMPLGSDACRLIRGVLEDALRVIDEWEPLAVQTDFPKEDQQERV